MEKLRVNVLLDYDDIERLTGIWFDDKLSVDSMQALMEGFKGKEVGLGELMFTIEDAIVNEDNDEDWIDE
jgi:hypothetical protein